MSRKRNLVDHGFRLPSAMDNRPLRWEEFLDRIGQTIYLSATPGNYELAKVGGEGNVVEQIIRPTGLVDPEVIVKPTKGQIDDLIARDQRPHREERAGPGHDADQEDVRGPHRLPARGRHPHPLPALRGRHPAPDRAAARAADGGVRRPGRHQPAARGPRPARGLAGGDPRRRQGGLPALRQVADPDHRPRRPQRLRPGLHVRRQDHAVDGEGDRRDEPAPREAGRLQQGRTASTRSRCARRSPTSPRCWPARTRPPRSCSPRGTAPVRAATGAGRRRCRRCRGSTRRSRRTARGCPTWPACRPPTSPSSSSSSPSRCTGAAAELQFEVAARLRDEISELKKELRQMLEATR